ncbi:MAG: tetratricopeptide repeat protein [Alphaproteobacteria bacterium]|nr:tetratricopeptide repeat protein [Alphaproteobacteria bacterium]
MTVRLSAILLLTGVAGCANLANPPGTATGGNEKSDELIRMARDVETHGSEDTALVLYDQAVNVSGHSPAAYVQLGDAYARARRFTEAAKAYRTALAADPNNGEAQLGLGAVLVQRGSLESGLAALAKAAPLVNTGAAYNRLGVALTMAGRFSEAQQTFERGLGLAPDDIDITTNLALAAALAEESDKAASLVNKIATSPAAKPLHRRNLVIVLGIIGSSPRDARAVAPDDLSQSAFNALFGRAASIRHITNPVTRAHALGTIQG